jgi:hypothetical protein
VSKKSTGKGITRMTLKIARIVNLLLAALLAGNEFGTWAAVHRALWSMPTPEHIKAEQALTRRFASIMPFWMVSVLVSCLPALALTRRGGAPAFSFTLAGTLCFVTMLVSTVRGNVPINNRTLDLSPEETPSEEWRALRGRWDRLHTLRVVLNVAGLSLLLLGALGGEDRR